MPKSDRGPERSAGMGIGLYCALVTGLAWVGRGLDGDGRNPGVGFLVWGASPLVSALVIRLVFRDWGDLGLTPRLRRSLGVYAMALIAIPLAAAVSVAVGRLTSASALKAFDTLQYATLLAEAAAPFFVFAFFEEFGWRGYLSPKLASAGAGPLATSLIVGAVWAAWHIPFLLRLPWIGMSEPFLTFFPRFFVACVVLSFLYGELRSTTGSLWPAVLLHAAGNAVGHPLEAKFLTIRAGWEPLGAVGTSLEALVVYALLGLTLRGLARRRSLPKAPIAA